MNTRTPLSIALVLGLSLVTGTALAQSNPAPASASPAKKELVAKLLKLQQPAIETLSRNLAEQPAAQLLNQAGTFLQMRVPADKREAIAKDIGNDVKAYALSLIHI